jgi:hydrogenase maturation protein HypF
VHARRAGIDPASTKIAAVVPAQKLAAIERIAARGEAPLTSSAGRLFDAVAALAGVAFESRFEGDAAMQLEAAADRGLARAGGVGYELEVTDGWTVEPRSAIAAVVADAARGLSADRIAARFHLGLAEAIRQVAVLIRESSGIDRVVLTGGVFANALLTRLTAARLAASGFEVLRHRTVPPNDGGLAFGQLAIAAARDAVGPE